MMASGQDEIYLKGFSDYEAGIIRNKPCVYFVSDGYYIKIGQTKRDVLSRLKGIQTGTPRPLKLMAVIVCDRWGDDVGKTEKELHRRFKEKRSSGEWFAHNAVVFDLLDNLTLRGGYCYLGHRIIMCQAWKSLAKRFGVAEPPTGTRRPGIGYDLKVARTRSYYKEAE